MNPAGTAVRAGIRKGGIEFRQSLSSVQDLWNWLQDQGWREVRVRPDRRRYGSSMARTNRYSPRPVATTSRCASARSSSGSASSS